LNKEKIDPRYFTLVFNSRYGQEQVNNVKSAKTTKQTELGIENLKKIQIPIPPLNTQREIVAKLYAMYEEIADLQNTIPYQEKATKQFEQIIFA
jgi:restriction endonuclease S subunit